ncbi:MAG TPA: reverse transcriptase-like protein [Myxococcaceae bacterium]|nr:reverse transcriptase-like protein [Myxococcaceae bacterium]
MPGNQDAEILRHIAREEPLTATQQALGITRERISRILQRAAELMDPGEANAAGRRESNSEPGSVKRVRVYSDGAARGNPGPAGAGAVLVEPNGQVVERIGKFLGTQTNNFAEYMGLLLGLRRAKEMGVAEVEVYADSELMIRQLGGRYQVKSLSLRPLYEEALELLNGFSRVKLVHVPREMNSAADEMSNRAIDEQL